MRLCQTFLNDLSALSARVMMMNVSVRPVIFPTTPLLDLVLDMTLSPIF